MMYEGDLGTFQVALGAAAEADGDVIGQWQDQSGNATHLAQVVATANKPILKLNQINGHSAVRFDGDDDYMTVSVTLNQPSTLYLVVCPQGHTVDDYLTGGNGSARFDLQQANPAPQINIRVGNVLQFSGPAVGVWRLITVEFNGATSSGRLNNGSKTTGNAGTNNSTAFVLGAKSGPGGYSKIDVAGCYVFGAILDAITDTQMLNYINQRFALW
jgi:hypothetical protein